MESVIFCKLEIFIPESHLAVLQETLRRTNAGHIGRYDCCLSYSTVVSTWRPLEGTTPYIGRKGLLSTEPELKIEVTCAAAKVKEIVAAVKSIHPYEEPVINAIPLYATGLA